MCVIGRDVWIVYLGRIAARLRRSARFSSERVTTAGARTSQRVAPRGPCETTADTDHVGDDAVLVAGSRCAVTS